MKLKKLSLKNFRNFENLESEFCDGINIFCGENGSGKTNLLEAVWMLSGVKSFRGTHDKDLIKLGQKNAEIKAISESGGVERELKLTFGDKKTAFVENKAQKSPQELSEYVGISCFSPADLELASEGPSVKRKCLDLTLSVLFPKYAAAMKIYLRALDQRNAVLRDARYHREIEGMLYPIEFNMERAAEVIVAYRKRLIELYSEIFPEIYKKISGGKETAGIVYLPKCEKGLSLALKNSRREDILSGNTSFGPHRDDVLLTLDNGDIKVFASQGQKRSVALSLKLAEAAVIERVRGEKPIILLDDVMSELDPARQARLIMSLDGSQVFITCCDRENIKSLEKGKVFEIKEGRCDNCISI